MLCLGVLFGNNLLVIPTCSTECVLEFVSFDTSTGSRTSLEKLKDTNIQERIANQLIDYTTGSLVCRA